MTRLEGRPLSEVAATMSVEDKTAVARDLGGLMRAMHDAEAPSGSRLALDWARFVDAQAQSAPVRHAEGAPAAWLQAIPGWLGSVLPELTRFRPTLISADLHAEHVLVAERAGRTSLVGVLDFGDALIGDPAYDFVTPLAFIVRGRAPLMSALLDGYGVPAGDRTPELRRRFTAYELLHRHAQLARDVRMLDRRDRELATLSAVESALVPMGEASAPR
jgi:hygromycin-B 7''-O-kinase